MALTTIRSAKGLEAPIVILTELDGIANDPKKTQKLYTAISRAQHQLIILASPAEILPAVLPGAIDPEPLPDEPEQAPRSTRIPTPEQQAVIGSVVNGSGDGIVEAVAGSGKTWTLVEAAKHITTREAIFLAFNTHIAAELNRRLAGTNMSAKTIHSLGMSCLRRYLGAELQVEEHKYQRLTKAWCDTHLTELESVAKEEAVLQLRQLVDLARQTLTPLRSPAKLRELAMHYSIAPADMSDALVSEAVSAIIEQGVELARNERIIDFSDMLYLPYHWRLHPWKVAWVFVDEAQDLSPAQLSLVQKCCLPDGRFLFVGDPHQAIYGFAGADTHSFAHIREHLHATEFSLSVSFRCPPLHTQLVRDLVPAITSCPGAEPGIVAEIRPDALPHRVRAGDLVLCRKTAPLVATCIALISKQISARVKGRDISQDLSGLILAVSHQPGYCWEHFLDDLHEYEQRQSQKLSRSDATLSQLPRLHDQVAAITACYVAFDAQHAGDLIQRMEEIFREGTPDVVLSTVHRAKGLEADRVFILEPDSMPLRWPGQQTWELEQEENIRYVALTRARKEMYFVSPEI